MTAKERFNATVALLDTLSEDFESGKEKSSYLILACDGEEIRSLVLGQKGNICDMFLTMMEDDEEFRDIILETLSYYKSIRSLKGDERRKKRK